VFRITAILVLMASGMRAQTPPAWLPSYDVALGRIKEGDFEGGFRELRALGASFPGDAQLATSIGAALDSASRHEEAGQWYEKALAIDPQYEPALNDLALSLASREEFEKAVPLLQRVLKVDPENARAAYNLGLITLRLERYKEAARAFQVARKGVPPPASPDSMALAEGTALFKLRRYSEAAALLRSSSPCLEEASCLLLGSSEALSNDLPRGINTFQTAVRLAPKNADAYFRLALAFLEGRRDEEAKNVLTAGLEVVPNSALLLYGQAIFYEYLGSYQEALTPAMKSIEENPARAEVWSLLGTLRTHLGQTAEAEKAFHRAIELGAGADTTVEYAEFLIHSERYSEAEQMLNKLRQSGADDAALNRALGKLYKAQGKLGQAVVFLRRAVTKDPEDAAAHYALATTLQRLNRAEEAKKELDLFTATKDRKRFVRVLQIASDPAATDAGEK
jgi:Flp pilus assembly protein TadD